jgi:hypothetical protein
MSQRFDFDDVRPEPRPGDELQRRIDAERASCRMRGDVAELRERVAASGVQMRSKTDAVMLARVLDHARDVDLAAEAILMEPRPQWVRTLIGGDLMKVYPRV